VIPSNRGGTYLDSEQSGRARDDQTEQSTEE